MARNRKNDSLRLKPALTAVVLCAFFVALGIGFVWYKEQIDLLGRQIKDRETTLTKVQRENKIRGDQLATLCSPVALDARVKKLNLGLGPPAFSQVIRLVDMPEVAPSHDQRQAQAAVSERNN
ncbi:MAG TPA: hypothetical protein VH619_06405 [Verrucomicrobiae bacterium]|jgi:hypothetical protein|nr:hypothetical protein [Verrucomicrobiae bacterium]